MEEDEFIIL